MNIRELIDIVEGKFRSRDIEDFVPENDDLDDVKSQYLPDWEMLDHLTLQAKYVAKDAGENLPEAAINF